MVFLITAPEIVDLPEQTIVGFGGEFSLETRDAIPKLWWLLHSETGLVKNGIRATTFGVYKPLCPDQPFSYHEPYTYLAGVASEDSNTSAPSLSSTLLQRGRYGLFRFTGSYIEVTEAFDSVMLDWLPQSGFRLDSRPVLECYPSYPFGSREIPRFEIWLPLAGPGKPRR
ncbi:DNA gyrase inhibitor [Thalassovita gelatinovora]|uniref:DNA gyrase inhibitor n=1 Tax=Thalassovita gelatinovora TaxID=53501 RepID=A0A0P1FTC6_THAGE|nr:GyrI-like domain-containing protein [Thalassovita gelatinovora]QIZ81380.1 GyrI-like domain-containing protein [Thalassovita gelatinovora]CUH64413.1 DNA gyrase inhibitor [Thalassovita gelatinovora]SER20693.1 Predicted transcriptional regulator YdeE, contains AraC-type DNA-binding domain [Thalassovita gelatinovora]